MCPDGRDGDNLGVAFSRLKELDNGTARLDAAMAVIAERGAKLDDMARSALGQIETALRP